MNGSKSAKTSEFIITKVAPLFNQRGYVGTSMSEITQVTGLTKGAIYGNFKNKEDLAYEAFAYNVRRIVDLIKKMLQDTSSAIEQLRGLVAFYRNYESHIAELGGCPIVNFGVDANYQNPQMLKRVQEIVVKLQGYIEKMILVGIEQGEILPTIDAKFYAQKIYTLIQGAVFMTFTMEDKRYLNMMMDHVDQLIDNELRR
jgi:AcrR family transcriptional regulator